MSGAKMTPLGKTERLDRHALVMAVWLSFGFVAVVLFSYGLGVGGTASILLGFASILAAFIGHVIVNAVYGSTFRPRELALALVLYAAGLVAFGAATLFAPDFPEERFLPISIGFLTLFAVVLFYMITHFGMRRVFEAFDVIGDFGAGEKGQSPRERDPR